MNTLEIERLLNIGIELSANADSDSLMREIVDVAMDLTDCDGGTLYILENDALAFHIMVTLSLGIDRGGHGQTIELPPVALKPTNVCARAALDKTLINVADVYEDQRFDFSGPRRYDQMTGYRTQSMLVIPMLDDKGDTIGVLQLLNAKNEAGETVPFPKDREQVIQSLASQAAIRLTNLNYSREITALLESMVQVLSTAIDARSPYNANHTRNMARYGRRFLTWLRENHPEKAMTPQEEREFLMAVWLHDVGKLGIALSVMDKASRIEGFEDDICKRFELIELLTEIRYLRGECTLEQYEETKKELAQDFATIQKANKAGFLTDDLYDAIQAISKKEYIDRDGLTKHWLTDHETETLSIRKGTLTAEERSIMESHVVLTRKMLERIRFSKEYSHVTRWASNHHELLNGSGYPQHLKGEQLSFQERLLTILDIFDALTASDRPYRKAIPREKAFDILRSMVDEGKLDGEVLELYLSSDAWAEGE
ncbi:MAG: GAF domain-containing protein [Lachnospiraceae bacterium]|nr:GAF domain-containing protein [Lachnospiraceae bacterium]MBQ3907526.1 GAF domain-containing protein [Lachnospiraceae bacterium]